MMCFLKRKINIIILLLMLFLNVEVIFADGWVEDGFGNWLYEENGQFVKNDTRVIDGIAYYFNHEGYWLPREPYKEVRLKSQEKVTFTLEGKDDSDRNYKTQVSIVMPIVEGKNEDALNEYIRKDFERVITDYIMEWKKNMLFLLPTMEADEMLEGQNSNGVMTFCYFNFGMFNLYLDTKKLEMWTLPNQI